MRAVAQDWVDALAEYPAWAIGEAASEWLRTQEKKPTIAGIRKLAQQHFAIVDWTRFKAMRGPKRETELVREGNYTFERPVMTEGQRAERKAQLAEVAANLAAKMEAGA